MRFAATWFCLLLIVWSGCAPSAPREAESRPDPRVARRAALLALTRDRLAREQELGRTLADASTFAVADLRPEPFDPEQIHFGRALVAVMTTALSRVPDLRLVERQEVETLLAEIDLVRTARDTLADPLTVLGTQQRLARLAKQIGGTPYYTAPFDGEETAEYRAAVRAFQRDFRLEADGVVGPRTRAAIESALREAERGEAARNDVLPRAGRMLGARNLLTGVYSFPSRDRIRVLADVIDASTGLSRGVIDVERPLEQFHELPGAVALSILTRLDREPSERLRREIMDAAPVPRSLAAFLAFGKGLGFEDEGRFADADAAYAEALRLDPQFSAARARVELAPLAGSGFEQSVSRVVRAGAGRHATGRALGAIGTGAAESEITPDAATGSRSVQADGSPSGIAHISGQIPVPSP